MSEVLKNFGTCLSCKRERKFKAKNRQLCGTCYNNYLADPTNERNSHGRYESNVCIVNGCENRRHIQEYCAGHGERFKKYGDVLEDIPIRKHSGRIQRTSRGGNTYWALWKPGHPLASRDNYVLEHRYIMYEAGLLDDPDNQSVHHKDHNGLNNDLDNLEVLSAEEHRRTHQLDDGTINQYGYFPPRPEICVIDGCSLKRSMLDMCSAHGTRLRRYGDPLMVKRVTSETVHPYILAGS